MPITRYTITDADSGLHEDGFRVDESDIQLTGASKWSIESRTLRGGLSEGVHVVELNNGALSVSVLPTRGMGLWRASFGDIPIGWNSPVGRPVHPAFVDPQRRGGIGWLDGFNELLCRCGLSFHGPPGQDGDEPLTLHGRVANLPAHHVETAVGTDGSGQLSVTGIVDEASLFGARLQLVSTVATTAGSNTLHITDEVRNLGGQPADLEVLYHLNVGRPFLEKGSKLVAPVREMAPRDARAAEDIPTWDTYAAPLAGYAEQVHFFELAADADGRTSVLLRNSAGDLGLSLAYARADLPWFTQWKNTQAEHDGYVTGLEPSTSFPNLRSFEREQERVIVLPPGESRRMAFSLSIHADAAAVTEATRRVEAIQAGQDAVIHDQPIDRFSPPA